MLSFDLGIHCDHFGAASVRIRGPRAPSESSSEKVARLPVSTNHTYQNKHVQVFVEAFKLHFPLG